ncbi:unnamed protein product [Tenebrio molitor]|nr:unnamed protein product [Tenebrio molitor]
MRATPVKTTQVSGFRRVWCGTASSNASHVVLHQLIKRKISLKYNNKHQNAVNRVTS